MSSSGLLRTISKALQSALPELREDYCVESLSIFGSIARGEAGPGSDVDLLVRFVGRAPGLLRFVELEQKLSEIVGAPVDLVMETALKPRLRDRILAEAEAVAA